jgi:hypothetical protein
VRDFRLYAVRQFDWPADLKVVVTDGAAPTLDNSDELRNRRDLGRGSFVFFNQASMFTGPETGFDTLSNARKNGHSGHSDFGANAKEAFAKAGMFFRA